MLRGARREKCKSMGMTMTQKILAAHAGLPEVKAGDLIEAKLDLVLGNDVTTKGHENKRSLRSPFGKLRRGHSHVS